MLVALATCAEVPDGDEDAPLLRDELRRLGLDAESVVWDDAAADWGRFDLVVLRSTWDYAERRDEFLAWVERLPRVRNREAVVRWNTDKRYLAELAGAGVPVVPTRFHEPGRPLAESPGGRFVLKPSVSAGSRQTASYEPGELADAQAHVRTLHAEGRTAMVQPYLDGIDEAGETALVYIAGSLSHAVTKAALLRPGQRPGGALFLAETISPRRPSAAELEVGERALEAVPFPRADLLYARVDLLPTAEGPVVLEVELTEPSLFLAEAPGAAGRLAQAVADAGASGG